MLGIFNKILIYKLIALLSLGFLLNGCDTSMLDNEDLSAGDKLLLDKNMFSNKKNEIVFKADEPILSIPVKDFIDKSGLKAVTPQTWIFDTEGTLVSSEFALMADLPLNIESAKIGPGKDTINKLEHYLGTKNIQLNSWRKCNATYCVIRILPDVSLGECGYCEINVSKFNKYLIRTNTTVEYRTILLTKE